MFFQHNQLRPSWKEVASVRLKCLFHIQTNNQTLPFIGFNVVLLVIWTSCYMNLVSLTFWQRYGGPYLNMHGEKNISSTGIAQEYVLQHTSQTMELVMKVARAYLTARSSSTKISVVEHTVHVRPHSRINSQYACPMQAILTMTCAHNSRC